MIEQFRSERAAEPDFAPGQEAALLISLALAFHNGNDLTTYASRAGLSPDALGLPYVSAVHRALLVATLRLLEGK
jgi:hypothetical protein